MQGFEYISPLEIHFSINYKRETGKLFIAKFNKVLLVLSKGQFIDIS